MGVRVRDGVRVRVSVRVSVRVDRCEWSEQTTRVNE